jgi:hypothetical protein
MKGLFTISYVLLWGLVVLETLLLREILRKTIRFKRLYADFTGDEQGQKSLKLRAGARVADFSAPMLDTDKHLTISDFEGHPSILLFVRPETSPSYKNLPAAIHGMWQKSDGHLFLICGGNEAACRQLIRDNPVWGLSGDQVPVVLDEAGRIAKSFFIDSTPQAVMLDEDFRVIRYGYPVPETGDEAEAADDQILNAEIIDSQSVAEKSHVGIDVAGTKHGNNGEPCDWPDDRPSTGAGFARVDTTVSCVMTRFQLRSVWSLIPFYLAFRRVRRSSRSVSGLLKAVFLIEDLHTCYTMSLWQNDCAIVEFGSIQAHVAAANSAFAPTWRKDLRRAEIWSAQFRLWAVSAHNLAWEGLDLQTVLADQWARRVEVARNG